MVSAEAACGANAELGSRRAAERCAPARRQTRSSAATSVEACVDAEACVEAGDGRRRVLGDDGGGGRIRWTD